MRKITKSVPGFFSDDFALFGQSLPSEPYQLIQYITWIYVCLVSVIEALVIYLGIFSKKIKSCNSRFENTSDFNVTHFRHFSKSRGQSDLKICSEALYFVLLFYILRHSHEGRENLSSTFCF